MQLLITLDQGSKRGTLRVMWRHTMMLFAASEWYALSLWSRSFSLLLAPSLPLPSLDLHSRHKTHTRMMPRLLQTIVSLSRKWFLNRASCYVRVSNNVTNDFYVWWRHNMKTCSTCEENTIEYHRTWPVIMGFYVSFVVSLNKFLLNKQSDCPWFVNFGISIERLPKGTLSGLVGTWWNNYEVKM